MTKTNKKSNFTGIVFLGAIIVITLFLAIFIFITIGKPFVIDNIKEIEHVTVENYKTYDTKHEDYYVYVYNKNSDKYNELELTILEYANFARLNSDALPIYAMDYSLNPDIINSSNLNYTASSVNDNLPTLIRICHGEKEATQKTLSTIKTELFEQMGK